jgi:hypothetical protein
MNAMDASYELSAYLQPNERVLWQGHSRRQFNLTSGGWMIFLGIFLAIVVVVIGVIMTVVVTEGVRSEDTAIILVILSIVLLSVGLGVGIPLAVVSRRFGDARYVVTSSAAYIASRGGWGGRQTVVVPFKSLPLMSLVENRDGTGTIVFGQSAALVANARYSGNWWMGSVPAFWNVERPLEVYQLIRRQMAEG